MSSRRAALSYLTNLRMNLAAGYLRNGQLRVNEIAGRASVERIYIDKLIDHLAHWPEPECQSCHGPVNDSSKLASLPINSIWFGERYVELLREQRDAHTIPEQSLAKLKASPNDDNAKIHLAFATRAMGSAAEADRLLMELPWADYPGRQLVKPRMMTTFP